MIHQPLQRLLGLVEGVLDDRHYGGAADGIRISNVFMASILSIYSSSLPYRSPFKDLHLGDRAN